MATVYLYPEPTVIRAAIHKQPGVKTAVYHEAGIIYSRARATLARHRQEGNAILSIEEGRVDSYVHLDDPPAANSPGAAMSIEFGHWQFVNGKPTGKFTPGIYALTGAAGLLGGMY